MALPGDKSCVDSSILLATTREDGNTLLMPGSPVADANKSSHSILKDEF